jgi:hypothetical protein
MARSDPPRYDRIGNGDATTRREDPSALASTRRSPR